MTLISYLWKMHCLKRRFKREVRAEMLRQFNSGTPKEHGDYGWFKSHAKKIVRERWEKESTP